MRGEHGAARDEAPRPPPPRHIPRVIDPWMMRKTIFRRFNFFNCVSYDLASPLGSSSTARSSSSGGALSSNPASAECVLFYPPPSSVQINHHVRSDVDARDESRLRVRVRGVEGSQLRGRRVLKDEHRAVHGVRDGSGHDELGGRGLGRGLDVGEVAGTVRVTLREQGREGPGGGRGGGLGGEKGWEAMNDERSSARAPMEIGGRGGRGLRSRPEPEVPGGRARPGQSEQQEGEREACR